MCESLELVPSSYYAWKTRAMSERSTQDEAFKGRIRELYEEAKGRYGHRPIYHHMQEEELSCGRDRVLRLMQELGICAVKGKRFKPVATKSKHRFGYSENRLKQLGKPDRLDQVWVADTTYLPLKEGWCYLATVMDLFSRRILGWSVSEHNDSSLVCRALKAAVLSRGGSVGKALIHHSDRGSTYAGHQYTQLLRSMGICPSMSAAGNCYDNAAQESFYGRYKTTSIGSRRFTDLQQARSHAFEYIELFYNRFRKHSSLGYHSPIEFEQKFCPHGGNPASLPACINNN